VRALHSAGRPNPTGRASPEVMPGLLANWGLEAMNRAKRAAALLGDAIERGVEWSDNDEDGDRSGEGEGENTEEETDEGAAEADCDGQRDHQIRPDRGFFARGRKRGHGKSPPMGASSSPAHDVEKRFCRSCGRIYSPSRQPWGIAAQRSRPNWVTDADSERPKRALVVIPERLLLHQKPTATWRLRRNGRSRTLGKVRLDRVHPSGSRTTNARDEIRKLAWLLVAWAGRAGGAPKPLRRREHRQGGALVGLGARQAPAGDRAQ
jgi:hypothetical protein